MKANFSVIRNKLRHLRHFKAHTKLWCLQLHTDTVGMLWLLSYVYNVDAVRGIILTKCLTRRKEMYAVQSVLREGEWWVS